MVNNIPDDLNNSELFKLRKETLLKEMDAIFTGSTNRFQIQWRLRLVHAALAVYYLNLCITNSKAIQNIPPGWQFIIIGLLFCAFFLYDGHIGYVHDRQDRRSEFIKQALRGLPREYRNRHAAYVPPTRDFEREDSICKKMWRKACQLKKLEYLLFSSTVGLLWLVGLLPQLIAAWPNELFYIN
ncbi:hypothetical protein GWO43_02250 [candidate division KSB1 bacterium]|nr:hypothetical protein [candidate division KSB1 bacterium]NIR69663.1 hypothetical protein [candidate division KSB1 bacterium]NIS22892.1 hypothetical protein [candidate division KSB1 bacterium]NIT69731.1 hypothetical protein [candidate division KSB1 bacterium]NIU23398.1 hypothetical protein [candidate division KSB1 bacterium]